LCNNKATPAIEPPEGNSDSIRPVTIGVRRSEQWPETSDPSQLLPYVTSPAQQTVIQKLIQTGIREPNEPALLNKPAPKPDPKPRRQ